MTCDSCRLEPGAFLVWFPGQAPLPAPVFFVCRRCLGGVPDDKRMQMTVLDLERSGLEAVGAQLRGPR